MMLSLPRFAPMIGAFLIPLAAHAQQAPQWLPYTPTSIGVDAALAFGQNPVLDGVAAHPRPIWVAGVYKMPSDPPGTWTVSFTVRGLQGYGNPGFAGMLLAKWTPGAAVPLVLTHEAAAANDLYVDYNLVLEPITKDAHGNIVGGRYGTFDRFEFVNGALSFVGAYLTARPDDTQPFGPAMEIHNLTGIRDYVDPVTAHVDGRLKLLYLATHDDGNGNMVEGIYMDDLLTPETNPTVAGHPVLVVRSLENRNLTAHAPIPLNGSDGETKALLLAMLDDSNASDIYFAADLDPETPAVHAYGTLSTYYHGGGAAGGTLLYKDNANEFAPVLLQTSILLGDTVGRGEAATIDVLAYGRPGTRAFVAAYAGIRWRREPVDLAGIAGQLGLSITVPIGFGFVDDADQRATFHPRVPGIPGLEVPIQALTTFVDDQGHLQRVFTNTAEIRVR